MSGSYWGAVRTAIEIVFAAAIIVLVCLTIWHVASNNAHEQIEAQRYSENYAQDAGDRIKSDCLQREGVAIYECAKNVIDPAREQQRDEYDLAAQRGMERWAFWMLAATL